MSVRGENGQAMTEFVITATMVLLPFFLFVPMLGKYIDFKHQSIQAARYQAWEYTVWYEDIDDRDILENFNTGDASFLMPEKPVPVTRQESRVRLMTTVGADPAVIRPITIADYATAYSGNSNVLWRDHRGLPFFDGSMDINEVETNDDTPTLTLFGVDVGSWLNTLIDIVQVGFDAISAIINVVDGWSRQNQTSGDPLPGAGAPFAGTAGFSAMNTDGYSHTDFGAVARVHTFGSEVRTRLDDTRDGQYQDLAFQAKAGVLGDGWNAGGTAHTYLQAGGATPSTLVNELLNLPGLSQIWDLIAFIAPELSRCDPPGPPDPLVKSPLAAPEGHLWLGYVDGDVVHPDRLGTLDDPATELGTHQCDDSGRCTWTQDVQALDPALSHSPCTL